MYTRRYIFLYTYTQFGPARLIHSYYQAVGEPLNKEVLKEFTVGGVCMYVCMYTYICILTSICLTCSMYSCIVYRVRLHITEGQR